MIKRFSFAAAILVATVGTVLTLSTVPAAAAEAEYDDAERHDMTGYQKECIDRDDVEGCVMSYGDILWLDDQERDGWGVKLLWWDQDGPRYGECHNNTGSGGWGADWARCNKNLQEGHVIKWKVSWYEDGQWHNSSAEETKI